MEKIKSGKLPKWKYAKPKKKMDFEEYLILPENKKIKVTIKNWIFTDGNVDGYSRTILRTDVVKLDGKEIDRILIIKNYQNVQELKKYLAKKKSARDIAELELTRKYNTDEMDYYFDIKY